MQNWPFADAPDVLVFTSKEIAAERDWVYYVSHDAGDGAWQFHPKSGPASVENSAVILLKNMLAIDASLAELADLPLGWCAWRDEPDAEWERMEKEE